MNERKKAIEQQLLANKDANVLFSAAPQMLEIDERFKTAFQKARAETVSEEEEEELVAFAVRHCVRRVLDINQYIQIPESARDRLARIYRRTWSLVKKGGAIDVVLRTEHYPAIQVWLSGLYPEAVSRAVAGQPEVRAVCCAEYSAALQLAVLGLKAPELVEPVLDVGCGFTAPLVTHLAACGVQVQGFDRFVEIGHPAAEEGDWFTYDFSARSWGTLLSHMAFSNHYRYALHFDSTLKQNLEAVFERMLCSLAPEGFLVMAPGSPELASFAEESAFDVETVPGIEGLPSTRIRRIAG